ncbi:MAG: phytanoyl-CoA dioxygenase family protein [Halieaceae bacterium]|nr:phytanoyl-CoA dioxygenase family protein [Halieaceae bacterium]
MSVDYRTRADSDIRSIGLEEFFCRLFPDLLSQYSACIEPWLSHNNPGELTIDCEGTLWSLAVCKTGIESCRGGRETGLKVKLTAEEFSGLVNDLYTPMTFFVSGDLNIQRGDMSNFLDWWMIIRALVDGRPIHVAGELEFRDASGETLNLQQSFTPADDTQDMRHFLEAAGFLHLTGVFSENEMAQISMDIDRYHDRYTEGDQCSWWATTADGARRLVRLQSFDKHSSATRALLQDPRFLQIGEISGADHTHCGLEGNAVEALIKPIDVVEGISDLPWHKDCSLGRHSYECCSLTVGISVTGAGPDSGQLRVIAGSHRALMWPALITRPETLGLPIIDLPTATGDITVHLSCTHHMSQAPTARERRVLYTGFRLPSVSVDSSSTGRARINRVREAAHKNVSQ